MQADVPKAEWRAFFDRMSKALTGKRAEIEVASLDLGDQITAEWLPLIGITYDLHDDLLDGCSRPRIARTTQRHPRMLPTPFSRKWTGRGDELATRAGKRSPRRWCVRLAAPGDELDA